MSTALLRPLGKEGQSGLSGLFRRLPASEGCGVRYRDAYALPTDLGALAQEQPLLIEIVVSPIDPKYELIDGVGLFEKAVALVGGRIGEEENQSVQDVLEILVWL
jgi:hypothetical protein